MTEFDPSNMKDSIKRDPTSTACGLPLTEELPVIEDENKICKECAKISYGYLVDAISNALSIELY